MHFRVSARTVLELGSELISSDEVALYELVKNSIDAKSRSGVELHFHISLSFSTYSEVLRELELGTTRTFRELADFIVARIVPSAEHESIQTLKDGLAKCDSLAGLAVELPELYAITNWIEVRDTGSGMSAEDIKSKYLVIGTPARKKAIDNAESRFSKAANSKAPPPTPFLGEKGVGRLSAMRLGWLLSLASATASDTRMNQLKIDWRKFQDLDLDVHDVEISTTKGSLKPNENWSGTNIKIAGLSGNWSPTRIRDIAINEFAKLSDPFSLDKSRFRIAVFFNGERVEIPRMGKEILNAAHATVRASYRQERGAPTLDVYMTFKGPDRTEDKHLHFGKVDLAGLTGEVKEDLPAYVLTTVGPFEFEAFWYNRQKLRGIDSIGDLTTVRDLQRRWSGIMLFRDGYRVHPYGEDKDDWLGLDRKALASPGYKLNKAQFIGRVLITRLGNPYLTDQTNREGLKETPEKQVLVEVLRYITQNLLRNFMDEVQASQRNLDLDVGQIEEQIIGLEFRASEAIRRLRKAHPELKSDLAKIQEIFGQMKEYFERTKDFAEQFEDEKTRLIQLAGIGLMLEVVAHELARSTETAMTSIAAAQSRGLPIEVAATLRVLRSEMMTMNKRLRVLDPLSVSGRQRSETFDLASLVKDSFSGRANQFLRHRIKASVRINGAQSLSIVGVKGMYVQIIENMASNSVFWLSRRAHEDSHFVPEIRIEIDSKRRVLTFSDNGPGVGEGLKEDIFKAFFSTKDSRRRQGLGLFIARECANYIGAKLYLSDKHTVHETRLNTFVLELPKTNA